MNAQPAGWHPDPHDASQWRYWNGSAWTEHRSPRFYATTPVAAAWQAPPVRPTGAWYFLITVLSCGVLAGVPFFHAASRLRRPGLRVTGAVMAGAILLAFVAIGLAPQSEDGEVEGLLGTLGPVTMLGVVLVSCLLLIGVRREVYAPDATTGRADANESARTAVEVARRKRAEARELAADDPMMARELGIGRIVPGTTKPFDDGGLLDLNHATAEQLTKVCGLPAPMAEAVVASRGALGRFAHVEDAIVYGLVTEDHAPMLRDRGIVIGDR
jgi:hypothetical protein